MLLDNMYSTISSTVIKSCGRNIYGHEYILWHIWGDLGIVISKDKPKFKTLDVWNHFNVWANVDSATSKRNHYFKWAPTNE